MPTGSFLRSKRLTTVYSHLGGLNAKDCEQEFGIIRVSTNIPESQHSALRIGMEKIVLERTGRHSTTVLYVMGSYLILEGKPTIFTKLLHPEIILRAVAGARLRVSRGKANPRHGNPNSATEPDKNATFHSNIRIDSNDLRNRTENPMQIPYW